MPAHMPADRCCCCISIRTGVTLIGLFVLLDIGKACYFIYRWYSDLDFGVPYLICSIVTHSFMVLGVIHFIQYWWLEDSLQTRKMLMRACLLIIFSQIATILLQCGWTIWNYRECWQETIKVVAVNIAFFMLYVYFMGITGKWVKHKQYQIKAHENAQHISMFVHDRLYQGSDT